MMIDLMPEEVNLLVQLVEEAIRELGPELHHTRSCAYKDDLKQQRRTLIGLQERLTAKAA